MPDLVPAPTERQDDDPFSGDTEGVLIAIPIPWEHSGSGCVEFRLVDWTVPDDDGERLPVGADVEGTPEHGAVTTRSEDRRTANGTSLMASVAPTKPSLPRSGAAGRH